MLPPPPDTPYGHPPQTALIVDILRTHQLLLDEADFKSLLYNVRPEEASVVFMGHSLGGACAVIAAAKVQVRTCRRSTL